MSPTYSSGVFTASFIIGSNNFGDAFFIASRKQARAAISKHNTLESTS